MLGWPWTTAEAAAARGVVLADLEVRRVGDDGVETVRLLSKGDGSIARMQNPGVGQYEVRGLQAHGEHYAATTAPVGEVVENRSQRRDQVSIDLMGDQFDGVRLRVPGNQGLHGRATENAGPGGGVEDPEVSPARLDSPGHELGNGNRCKKEAVLLAVSIGLACGVPFTDVVGVDHRSLALAWSRYGEGSGRELSDFPIVHILPPPLYSHPAATFSPLASEAVWNRRHVRGSAPSTLSDADGPGGVERAGGIEPPLWPTWLGDQQ